MAVLCGGDTLRGFFSIGGFPPTPGCALCPPEEGASEPTVGSSLWRLVEANRTTFSVPVMSEIAVSTPAGRLPHSPTATLISNDQNVRLCSDTNISEKKREERVAVPEFPAWKRKLSLLFFYSQENKMMLVTRLYLAGLSTL